MVITGGWGGEGNRELVFNGHRISFWEDEKFVEMNLHNLVDVRNATELYT